MRVLELEKLVAVFSGVAGAGESQRGREACAGRTSIWERSDGAGAGEETHRK